MLHVNRTHLNDTLPNLLMPVGIADVATAELCIAETAHHRHISNLCNLCSRCCGQHIPHSSFCSGGIWIQEVGWHTQTGAHTYCCSSQRCPDSKHIYLHNHQHHWAQPPACRQCHVSETPQRRNKKSITRRGNRFCYGTLIRPQRHESQPRMGKEIGAGILQVLLENGRAFATWGPLFRPTVGIVTLRSTSCKLSLAAADKLGVLKTLGVS